jgi:diguanylate cyclase (GGDEF)-like protein
MDDYQSLKIKHYNPEEFLILVVDDITKNLQLVVEILDNQGYATTFATSASQALERVKNTHPDLILLDLMMPEISGLEVCKHLKANQDYATIPIIFLTASNEKDHLLEAFKLGAVDYITKPFSSSELLARVKTHLDLKRTRDELDKAYKELEKLVNTDPLTNIANRRALFHFGEMEFNRAQRYNCIFSVLILDLDHFKDINDTYGHDIGDHALKLVANTILKSIRNVDKFGRFGGEEFVAILPETKLQEALIIADKIRDLISELSFSVQESIVKMTVSIGVATYKPDDSSIDTILKRADQALYQAKHQGRNQVVINSS